MIGTFLHDGNSSTADTDTLLATTLSAAHDTCAAHGTQSAPAESLHLTHGLVAIANGPDYCLCGHTWPCDRRAD